MLTACDVMRYLLALSVVLLGATQVTGQLTVTSLPDALFNGGSQTVVEGSVVWLYCQVNSRTPTVTATWTKDSVPLVQDVPHIRMRSSQTDTDTTFLLVVDTFQSSDSGVYQCTVQDGAMTGMGTALTLTASASTTGSLRFISSSATGGTVFFQNRAGYESGVDTATIQYDVGHVGDDTMTYTPPTATWLRNGVPVSDTPTNTAGGNGNLSTTLSFMFEESGAGVYQCVFTDTARSEVFVVAPIRLDTGELLQSIAISPTLPDIIILRPPEKLVLEISNTGRYRFTSWARNGELAGIPSSGFQPSPKFFAHFGEVYFAENTTMEDLGIYEATVEPALSSGQMLVEVFFNVISLVNANTTASSGADVVTVSEGGSVNIFCTSIGSPVPTISWTLNNQMTRFTKTDLSTEPSVAVTTPPNFAVTDGVTESTLQIVNTQYPADDGVYVCTGANTHDGDTTSTSAMITVQVLVVPVINVTADRTRVGPGGAATLTCTVTRGNPMTYTYSWTHEGAVLPGETSATLSLTSFSMDAVGAYTCEVMNDAGSGMGSITIELGVIPVVTARVSPSHPVIEGSAVDLDCEATSGDLPISYSWTGPSGQDVSLANTDGTISVTISASGDYGSYICAATNEFGMGNASVEVIQADPPNVGLAPGQMVSIEVSAGDDLSLSVIISGFNLPLTSISWAQQGNTLTGSEDRVTITNTPSLPATSGPVTSTLVITAITPTETGRYGVTAINAAGNDTLKFIVNVTVNPNITSFLPPGDTRYVVNVSDPVTFQCRATGVPPPTIQWYRGGRLIVSSMDSRLHLSNPTTTAPPRSLATVSRTLTISSVMASDADTSYSCNASNAASVGVASEVFEMFVQVPPVVVPVMRRVAGNESESAILMFRIESAIPNVMTSDIRWYYTASTVSGVPDFSSGDFLDITNSTSRTSESSLTFSGDLLTLTVSNIVQVQSVGEETDGGRYFLTTSNPAGEDSAFVDLIVEGPPQIVGGPPDQFVVNDGSNAVFECTALAEPEHQIEWSVNGIILNISTTEVSSSSKYSINRNRNDTTLFGALTVNSVVFEDRGTYSCQAQNVLGDEVAEANLTVHVIPIVGNITRPSDTLLDQPVAIFCLASGYPLPTVTWQQDGNNVVSNGSGLGRIDILIFRPSDADDILEEDSSADIEFLIMVYMDMITSLGELGVVSMLSVDSVIRGESGNYTCTATNQLPQTRTITTTSSPVPLLVLERPDPPESVHTVSAGAHWITLSWTPTFDGNRPVLRFILYIRNINISENFSQVANLTTSDVMAAGVTYNVSRDVLPFTMYSFRVEACNEIGCSDRSQESDIRLTSEDSADSCEYPCILTILRFQLRLQGVPDCTLWTSDNSVVSEITQEVVNELNRQCQCGFGVDQITAASFRCFPESPTAVTFRAEISESLRLSASQLTGFLEAWVSSGAVVSIQAQMLTIDDTCDVLISSFNEGECRSVVGTAGTTAVLGTAGTTAALIGGVVAGGLVLVLLLAIVVSTALLVLWKRKKKAKVDLPRSPMAVSAIYANEPSCMGESLGKEAAHDDDANMYANEPSCMGESLGKEAAHDDDANVYDCVDTPASCEIELASCSAYGIVATSPATDSIYIN